MNTGLMPYQQLALIISIVCVMTTLTTKAFAEDKPQSLVEIYSKALAYDPTLASALTANKAIQEIIEQAKALYRPMVNFTAGANVSRSNIKFIGTEIPFNGGVQSFEGYNYGVEVRQPLYRKQNLVQIDQAKTQVSQADKQLHLSQQELILRTTQTYFDVLITQDKVDLIAAQKESILSQLNQAKTNFEAGTVTITDVNEAQARYDLIVAQEIGAINEHQIAMRTMQAITGETPQQLATVKADIKTNALEQGMEKWLDVALQNNLSIKVQEDLVQLSDQESERAQAGHLPTLDAVASYNDSYANGGFYGFGNELKNATIGVQLQIPLYEGGSTSSHARQAVLGKQKARNDLDIARRKIELDTQRAYLNLSTSIAQVKAYEQALTSSQSQIDSTKIGYEVGVRTIVDVLNAQQQFFGAKRDLLQARYSYLVSIIRLKFISGIVAETDLIDINQQLAVN
ncbi:TolC family outer membrane protein [Methylobacter tundripaludum]|uniref:TolC family outer membrane protein n=1 Tax=Methylobacter tundripaludum TaxID=173365 RepID=UPI000AB5EE04|nr:TolC family outer membrane protein [Methylobacter tundripaludum]